MAGALDYFDQVICINRDERPDRWYQCQLEFARLGLLERVERFSAISIPQDPVAGCIASHKAAIDAAATAGRKNILIFEDDLQVVDTCGIPNAVNELKRLDWSLFYLGGYPSAKPNQFGYAHRLPETPSLCRLHRGYLTTHAYAVNASFFEAYKAASGAIDVWLAYEAQPNNPCYAIVQFAVTQRSDYSDLRGRQVNRDCVRTGHQRMVAGLR